MNKNLERLEFNKILEKLSQYCTTFSGKNYAYNLTPFNNADLVKNELAKTSLALELIYRKGSIPIEEFTDIELYLKTLDSSGTLSSSALLSIATVLKISRNMYEYFYNDESFDLTNFGLLNDIFHKLYSNLSIETKIFSSILDENTIADDASKILANLRKNRKKLEQEIRAKLTNFIHSSSYSKYIMDSIVTIRNERFVIPVKDEYKDKISGSILDISASGSTVYIEPSSIYDMNNKINQIKVEEDIEIEKILRNLSILLFPITQNLRTDYYIIGELDFIFSKAKYSKSLNAVCPKLNTEKIINLISAKHPLIDTNKVVPIDIIIGEKYTSLLITGPNTGGKTATLKTVGLLTAMACSGLHIPAKEGSSIFVFDNIFADIGDEQSIQESLSTFSSHIINIIDILKNSTSNSLILLDELGSGTDPIEGSSLAISILEYFHNIGSLTLVTTHYQELKNYALVTDGFENASSDFDVVNLRPTYRLLIGVPGKSNAFAISKNLGLPQNILDRATSFLKQDNINLENLLKEIYDDKLDIEKEKENIIKNSNQVELLRKSLERDNSKLTDEADHIIENAKIKARELLINAKEEANDIIKDLNSKDINLKNANNLRNSLNNSLNKLDEKIPNNNSINKINNIIAIDKIKIGDIVLVKKLNQNGTILSIPNKSSEVQVQIGFITMNVKISDLAPSTSNESTSSCKNTKKYSPNKISFNSSFKSKEISPELNVIGLNVDEAIPIVDKYLDNAYICDLPTIRIVHGKGTGKLREGIHSFLRKNPHVKSYRIGTFGEGEMGVTVVEIK